MNMVPKELFGRTDHKSSRVVFDVYALSQATQGEADRVLEVLCESIQYILDPLGNSDYHRGQAHKYIPQDVCPLD
jgi:hypothetical protein